MNKAEMINSVSVVSGVDSADCEKVLKALEKVFSDEISNSKGSKYAFDMIYKIMVLIASNKE